MAFDAIVLAGGSGRRLGGVDKANLLVGGEPMLHRALRAVAAARSVTVVGPSRPVPAELGVRPEWTREEPPGAGPLAAIAAGVPHGKAGVVVVVACDMPLLDSAAVAELVQTGGGADGAVLRDASGRLQPLAAAYDRQRLRSALSAIGDPRGQPVRRLFDVLAVREVPAESVARDADTVAELAALRGELRGHAASHTASPDRAGADETEKGTTTMLTDWAEHVATALGLDLSTDQALVDRILDLARDAAHSVDRPAAPLTTFLVGYAAGKRGGDPDAIAECERVARELTQTWTGEPSSSA